MLNIAICDDAEEFLFLEKQYIQKYMEQRKLQCHIDTFLSGIDFLRFDKDGGNYDIIFLDINMVKLNGIETAKKIREQGSQAYIVFVTAFVTYAMEGYKVDAVRYLLKDRDSLESSIEECLEHILAKMDYQENRLTFDFVEKSRTLNVENIVYIESSLHKLNFYVKGQGIEKYTMYEKLDVLDHRLQPYHFCRIHKSFLVNLQYVEEIERYRAKLTEEVGDVLFLGVSQARYRVAKEQFMFYQGEV